MLILLICLPITQTFATFVEDYYRKRDGLLLLRPDGSNPECHPYDPPLNQKGCAVLCTSTASCQSFSYREEDNCCVMNTEVLYDFSVQFVEDSAWSYYGPVRSDVTLEGWTLVFKAVNGSGENFWSAWLDSTMTHDLDLANVHPARFSKYTTSATYPFYRSHWLDDWPANGIEEVKLGLYISGTEVAYMNFDGSGSTRDDWFSYSRLTLYPWIDLSGANPAVFSSSGERIRKFYVAMSDDFNDCENFGWMIVLNRQGNKCIFDKETPTPQFLYSRGTSGNYFKYKGYGKAEAFAVFVKFSEA